MVFKSANELDPKYLSDFFAANSNNSSYNLKLTVMDFGLPERTSLNGQKSFSYRGVAT